MLFLDIILFMSWITVRLSYNGMRQMSFIFIDSLDELWLYSLVFLFYMHLISMIDTLTIGTFSCAFLL